MKIKKYYLSILILLGLSSIKAQAEWKDFESPENRFSITFFGEPEHTIDTSLIDESNIYMHIWYNEVSDSTHPNTSYTVSCTFLPENLVTSDSSQETIDNTLMSSLTPFNDPYEFNVSTTIPIEIDGYPGKEYKIKNIQEEYSITMRVFLVQNQFFMLMVRTEGNLAYNNVINQFFNSFELYNVKPGKYKLEKQEVPKSFTIDFPRPPKTELQTIESAVGILNVQNNMCMITDTTQNIAIYTVAVTHYPKDFEIDSQPQSINSYYNRTINEYIKTIGGQLKTMNASSLLGIPSKEFTCYLMDSKAELHAQFLFVDRKLFMIFVIAKPDKDIKAERDKFFNSFKLIK